MASKTWRKQGLPRPMGHSAFVKWRFFPSVPPAVRRAFAQSVPAIIIYLLNTRLARHAGDLGSMDGAYVRRPGFLSPASAAALRLLYEILKVSAGEPVRLRVDCLVGRTSREVVQGPAEDAQAIAPSVALHSPGQATLSIRARPPLSQSTSLARQSCISMPSGGLPTPRGARVAGRGPWLAPSAVCGAGRVVFSDGRWERLLARNGCVACCEHGRGDPSDAYSPGSS